MKNVVVFGAVQSGKSTLMGYMASASLGEKAFSIAASQKEKTIRTMELGSLKSDMILPSFVSMDRDELMDFADKNSPGTSKRIHRKNISIVANGVFQTNRYTFIDTPGSRDRQHEQYSGMFEGEVGLCVLSAIDIDHYFSLDEHVNKKKCRSEQRRLFTPIQFWNVYKGSENLIVVLSKCDYFADSSGRLKYLYERLTIEIEKICGERVPIIPTSIRLLSNDGVYTRIEQNVYNHDSSFSWYTGSILLEELSRRLEFEGCDPISEFRLGSAIRICQIPNSSNYALRIKCLIGTLTKTDKLILGPILTRDKKHVFLNATVKSLKYEDAELTDQLQEGSIGGVGFASITQVGNNSVNEFLHNFRLLRTTVLMAGNYTTGNILKLRLKLDELGESTLDALQQMFPKAQLQFYWLGRKMNADVIEHYESNEYIYISLANLSDISQGVEQRFALPILQEGYSSIECPVVLQYNEYRLEEKIEKYQVATHALFHVVEILTLDEETLFCIDMNVKDCFVNSEYIQNYFSEYEDMRVHDYGDDQKSIQIGSITSKTAHKIYKKLREFAVNEGFCDYQLKLFEQKCHMQREMEYY